MVKEVLVVGVNKVGKTSVIKGLAETGDHQTKVQDNFISQECGEWRAERQNIHYHFREAPGLAEAIRSDIDENNKLAHLEQLTIFAYRPIDLVIFVTRYGTIHSNTKDMYVVVTTVMPKTIPIICVVTGCENELDMNQWVEINRPYFERNGMIFREMLATCFGRGGRMEEVFVSLRKESATDLWETIDEILRSSTFNNKIRSIDQSTEHKNDDKVLSDTHGGSKKSSKFVEPHTDYAKKTKKDTSTCPSGSTYSWRSLFLR
jgi:hypothetical protein